jgi:hypothetical protein
VGPLPVTTEGYMYLLTTVARSTRWAEALSMRATAAADCTEVFIADWVSRYGVPVIVTSYRGIQFTLAFWAAMSARLGNGMKHKLTTAFHPLGEKERCTKSSLAKKNFFLKFLLNII